MQQHYKSAERTELSFENCIASKKLYRKKNEIKIFSDKRKIRESAVSRPAIQKKC